MFKKTFALLTVLCLVLGTLLFVGCGQSTGVDVAAERKATSAGPDYPIGIWESDYGEYFTINEKIVEYAIGTQVVYAGTFYDWVPDEDDEDSGVVFLRYTIAPYGKVGNYYAVRWERLDTAGGTVWLSGCADAEGKEDPDEAEAEYTEANKGKYFAYGSDCTKIGADKKGLKKSTEKPPYLKYLEEKTGLIIVK